MACLPFRNSLVVIALLGPCGLALAQQHAVDSKAPAGPSADDAQADSGRPDGRPAESPDGQYQHYPYAVPYGGAYGYGHRYLLSPNQLHFAYRQGRRIEMNRANAADARRQLEQYHRSRTGQPAPHAPPGPGGGGFHPTPGGYGGLGIPHESYHRFGRELEYYRQDELRSREELTLLVHRDFLARGVRQFRSGQYGEAARSFIAAAEKDHGDTVSRLHAGQALVAVGMYPEALAYFRRAFELQPKIIHVPLNLQADYGHKNDYVRHVAQLEAYCRENKNDGRSWLLLAIETFFGPEPERAAEAYFNAKKLLGKDYLTQRLKITAEPLLRNARPRTPPSSEDRT